MQPTQQPQQSGMMNPKPNLHAGTVARNHSAHEVHDVHEVLTNTINVLNAYTMMRPQIQCKQLQDIADRQYQFMCDEYNMLVQCFSTGQDPAHGTKPYQMKPSNEVTYGLQPSAPKSPKTSPNQIDDQDISSHMLGMVKANAQQKAIAACEVTNPVVRRVLAESIPNCVEMAYELFLYQNHRGFYQVPQLAEQDMKQLQNAFAPISQPPAH